MTSQVLFWMGKNHKLPVCNKASKNLYCLGLIAQLVRALHSLQSLRFQSDEPQNNKSIELLNLLYKSFLRIRIRAIVPHTS